MWGAFNALAEKAKAAAADLEGQINESVGIEPTATTTTKPETSTVEDDDVWKDDESRRCCRGAPCQKSYFFGAGGDG